MPDIFVPNDTADITSWYLSVANAGLLQRFAFDFTDRNRASLSKFDNLDDVLAQLPADDFLLQEFVNYASDNKIPARWYYINISRDLIVRQLKSIIVRDLLSTSDSFRVWNVGDPVIRRALKEFENQQSSAK